MSTEPKRLPTLSANVEAKILALANDVRPRMRLGRRRAIAIAVVVGLALVAALPLRGDLASLPMLPFALTTAVVLAVSVFAVAAATSTSRATGPRFPLLIAVSVVAPVAYALATSALPVRAIAPVVAPATWKCLAMAAMVAIAGTTALVVAFKNASPVSPRVRGAAFGAAAGAWAGLAMHLRCPSADPVHILVGHAGPIALVAILGAIVAPRFMRP